MSQVQRFFRTASGRAGKGVDEATPTISQNACFSVLPGNNNGDSGNAIRRNRSDVFATVQDEDALTARPVVSTSGQSLRIVSCEGSPLHGESKPGSEAEDHAASRLQVSQATSTELFAGWHRRGKQRNDSELPAESTSFGLGLRRPKRVVVPVGGRRAGTGCSFAVDESFLFTALAGEPALSAVGRNMDAHVHLNTNVMKDPQRHHYSHSSKHTESTSTYLLGSEKSLSVSRFAGFPSSAPLPGGVPTPTSPYPGGHRGPSTPSTFPIWSDAKCNPAWTSHGAQSSTITPVSETDGSLSCPSPAHAVRGESGAYTYGSSTMMTAAQQQLPTLQRGTVTSVNRKVSPPSHGHPPPPEGCGSSQSMGNMPVMRLNRPLAAVTMPPRGQSAVSTTSGPPSSCVTKYDGYQRTEITSMEDAIRAASCASVRPGVGDATDGAAASSSPERGTAVFALFGMLERSSRFVEFYILYRTYVNMLAPFLRQVAQHIYAGEADTARAYHNLMYLVLRPDENRKVGAEFYNDPVNSWPLHMLYLTCCFYVTAVQCGYTNVYDALQKAGGVMAVGKGLFAALAVALSERDGSNLPANTARLFSAAFYVGVLMRKKQMELESYHERLTSRNYALLLVNIPIFTLRMLVDTCNKRVHSSLYTSPSVAVRPGARGPDATVPTASLYPHSEIEISRVISSRSAIVSGHPQDLLRLDIMLTRYADFNGVKIHKDYLPSTTPANSTFYNRDMPLSLVGYWDLSGISFDPRELGLRVYSPVDGEPWSCETLPTREVFLRAVAEAATSRNQDLTYSLQHIRDGDVLLDISAHMLSIGPLIAWTHKDITVLAVPANRPESSVLPPPRRSPQDFAVLGTMEKMATINDILRAMRSEFVEGTITGDTIAAVEMTTSFEALSLLSFVQAVKHSAAAVFPQIGFSCGMGGAARWAGSGSLGGVDESCAYEAGMLSISSYPTHTNIHSNVSLRQTPASALANSVASRSLLSTSGVAVPQAPINDRHGNDPGPMIGRECDDKESSCSQQPLLRSLSVDGEVTFPTQNTTSNASGKDFVLSPLESPRGFGAGAQQSGRQGLDSVRRQTAPQPQPGMSTSGHAHTAGSGKGSCTAAASRSVIPNPYCTSARRSATHSCSAAFFSRRSQGPSSFLLGSPYYNDGYVIQRNHNFRDIINVYQVAPLIKYYEMQSGCVLREGAVLFAGMLRERTGIDFPPYTLLMCPTVFALLELWDGYEFVDRWQQD